MVYIRKFFRKIGAAHLDPEAGRMGAGLEDRRKTNMKGQPSRRLTRIIISG